MEEVINQDEIIDRITRYMYEVAGEVQMTPEDECARDGMVAGLAMGIAIAAGVTGPMEGRELGTVGTIVAAVAMDRMRNA